jgi:DNA-binding NarL/FixJ family response regulator
MQASSDFVSIGVGLFSSEPIRIAGLGIAFENHPSIFLVEGSLEFLLADFSIRHLILDFSYHATWMESLFMVRRVRPDIQQIILGPGANDEAVLRCLTAGARAYLDANSGPFALRQAVECVIQGSIWASRRLLSLLVDRLLNQQTPLLPLSTPVLSPRERQVLDLIMAACSNREIALELGIEERTVKAYVASLMRKTGADNRVSLSVQATQDSLRDQRVLI